MGTHRRERQPLAVAAAVVTAGLLGALVGVSGAERSDAATVTAAYAAGHRDVRVNGYGASGLGTFTLRFDPGDPHTGECLALCLEAHTSHTTRPGAYRRVPNRIDSPQLDYLLWRYGVPGTAEHVDIGRDHDTATALAALAWYYADAQRRHGGAVWADPTSGTAVSPVAPHPWNALPAGASPIGLTSAGVRLGATERRVHELYLEAEARRGPWTMSAVELHGRHARVELRGPAGPLAGVDGVRFLVRDRHGAVTQNQVVRTDGRGVAAVDVGHLTHLDEGGGSIEVSVFAPGVHEEWDGDGDVQRLATGTGVRLDRRLDVPPTSRYVTVVKRSTDDALSPVGARFALLDARDRTMGTVTTGADGRATFDPIDVTDHPGPFRVRELEAPEGLARLRDDIVVPSPVSTDRARPTVVEITNEPEMHRLRVRKVFDDDRVGPTERDGFGFDVTRDDGRRFGPAVTGVDGRTPVVEVTRGRYEVCERERPAWAATLADGGCVSVHVDGTADAVVEVVYTNLVPTPSITTRVHVDGDAESARAWLPPEGGRLVDVVTHTGLVPGTRYRLEAEVLALGDGDPSATGIVGATEFVAETPDGEIEVAIEVPPRDALDAFDVGVVVQRLALAAHPDDGTIAEHADPTATVQTFWMPSIDTVATADVDGATATSTDRAAYRGLPPGSYVAKVVWHERVDGTCRPTEMTARATFDVDDVEAHAGAIDVGPVAVEVGAGRTLVAFHTISLVDETGSTTVATHADCDAASQTVELAPPPVTPVTPVTPTPTTTATTTTTTVVTPPTTSTTTTVSPTTTTTTTPTTPTTPSTTTVPGVPSLPVTGGGLGGHAGVALMVLGAGGLVFVTGAHGRPRERR